MTTRLPAIVEGIGRIHFEGNIIPHPWYQRITLESGKPDLPAIIILAEIIYWYRPYQTLTKDGKPILRKHFDGDMFQCSAAYFEAKFGFTKTQARRAIARLEEGGLIRREFRDVVIQGILRNNITFIEPVPLAIMAITHPSTAVTERVSAISETLPLVNQTPSPVGETPSPVGEGLSLKSHLSEITTKTTTEITTTTPNPSSTNERAAGPGAAERSSGSAQDQTPENPAIGQELTMPKLNEEKLVAREEAQMAAATEERGDTSTEAPADEEAAELAYPAKLTEREREDIAAQIESLPTEIAQQMLDVVEAKIGAGQIKTSAAAVLRGIARKYRKDPGSFDPSTGFRVADVRRRREEAKARQRAEAEVRERAREALRGISPEARAFALKSLASIKRTLEGTSKNRT